jgi:hypothetical protein
MKLAELLAFTRETADDLLEKYQWSTPFITRALNEAENQACRRARLIVDSSTPAICRIPLVAGKSLYALDPRILFIRRVKLSTRSEPLGFGRVRDLDMTYPDWETETGDVIAWIPDFTSGYVRLFREPTSAEVPATVNLTVVREPLRPMVQLEDCPEIKPRYHYRLAEWALYRMFMQRDSERYDPDRAARHLAEFEAEFGKPSSAVEEQWIDANYDYAAEQGVF